MSKSIIVCDKEVLVSECESVAFTHNFFSFGTTIMFSSCINDKESMWYELSIIYYLMMAGF